MTIAENNPVPCEPVFGPTQLPEGTLPDGNLDRAPSLSRALQIGKGVLESAVILTAVGPANGPLRYGAFAATLASTENTLTSAAVLGGSTVLLEGAGALATSEVLSSERSNKTVNVVNKLLDKVVPARARISPIVEVGIANYAGTSVLLAAKQREDPTRTVHQNRRHGLFTAGWLGSACALQGALIAEGVTNATEIEVVAPSVLALGALAMGGRWAKNKFMVRDNVEVASETVEHDKETDAFPARYDLTAEELNAINVKMVSQAKSEYPDEALISMWISPKHEYANYIRNFEAGYFPEVTELSDADESQTLFLAVIDTRPGIERVVHGGTLTGVQSEETLDKGTDTNDKETGFVTVDSLIEMDNFTAAEFREYYEQQDVDLGRSIAVETNFRIGDRVPKHEGLGSAEWAYLMFFKKLKEIGGEEGRSVCFASINRASQISFSRLGLQFEPLMGRKDLITPESLQGVNSLPVAIPLNKNNNELFSIMPDMPHLDV